MRRALALVLLLGCGSKSEAVDAGPVLQCPAPVPTECAMPAPTFDADVKPILDARCNGCHVEGVPGGPWPLSTYDDVNDWREVVLNDIVKCTMPPLDAGVRFEPGERERLLNWFVCTTPTSP